MAKGGFRGGYGGMNQANMMKQAQKMQQDFLRMQKELEEKEFTAKSGGGIVSATVNGNREVTKIEITPEAVDPDDVEHARSIGTVRAFHLRKNACSSRWTRPSAGSKQARPRRTQFLP